MGHVIAAGPAREGQAAGDGDRALVVVGEAEWGLAVCDLPEGDRCYARFDDADLMAEAEATELVGASVSIVPGGDNVNIVKR